MIKKEILDIIANIQQTGAEYIQKIEDKNAFVDKILRFAIIIPYVEQNVIKGFIAYYKNDEQKNNAFLTLLAIDPKYQSYGLGRRLLEFSIKDLLQEGFKYYSLEVLKINIRAITLYKSLGFKIKEDRGDLWLMNLEL